jgi:hypothetical protein
MRWMRRAPILLLCAAWLALPAQALAISIAPPGKAGADQYFETLPSSGGNVAPPAGNGNGNSGSGSNALTHLGQGRAGASTLAHLGTAGAAAAGLAEATAPTPARSGHHGSAAGASTVSAPAGSTAGAFAHVLTGSDSGGLGVLLPLLLATGVIAAIGLAAARLRRGGGPPELSA